MVGNVTGGANSRYRRLPATVFGVLLTVVLAACGGSSDNQPTATSAQLLSPASTTASGTSTAGFSGTLDGATTAWFAAFCAASTSVAQQARADLPIVTGGAAGSAAGTPQARQVAAKDAYGRLAATFAAASTQLTTTPAPNLGNLPIAASQYATAMKEAGTAFADAGSLIAGATITDNASFESAATQAFSSLHTKLGQIQDLAAAIRSAVDPALEAAVRARFSECAGLE